MTRILLLSTALLLAGCSCRDVDLKAGYLIVVDELFNDYYWAFSYEFIDDCLVFEERPSGEEKIICGASIEVRPHYEHHSFCE